MMNALAVGRIMALSFCLLKACPDGLGTRQVGHCVGCWNIARGIESLKSTCHVVAGA
jgi:hypothetical protein